MNDDYPDDYSDHPNHPENHNFTSREPVSEKSLHNIPCERCGVMYKDHPYSKENQ